MAKGCCTIDRTDSPCSQTDCDWYIYCENHFNCFLVYKYFISKPLTLQETAKLLGMSHTAVKQIELNTIKKISNNDLLKRKFE